MLDGLRDALTTTEQQRKTIEVYSPSPDQATEIAEQFSTKNVDVVRSPLPADADEGFVIIRGPDGLFLGSLGLDAFATVLSPEIHPPWILTERETEYSEVFDFLDQTLFNSYNRRQMLATAREIEERAWRIGDGRLYTGFQRVGALQAQERVYERLADRDELSIRLYVSTGWENEVSDRLPVISTSADEIGAFWFVIYDGGGSEMTKCGLIAEERHPGTYYGFWTYNPSIIDGIVAYLEAEYGFP